METKDIIFQTLDGMGIAYERLVHERALTIEDCAFAARRLSAVVPKNLFLTPRNESAFYLCLTAPEARFKTADVSRQIGASRLSFGKDDRLFRLLNTFPGAISPMSLIFDPEKRVRLLIDRALLTADRLGFHPNDNTETLAMAREDFFGVFLKKLDRAFAFVEV